VPFAAPRLFVTALDAAHGRTDAAGQRLPGETVARQSYARAGRGGRHLSEGFRPDAVNLLMLHTHLTGAVFSGSERQVHLGDDWAATPQAIPARAQYVALGHIHKPPAGRGLARAGALCGSPLQMDFGEEGEDKSFVLIDARAGQPARIERVPYRGGRRLRRLRADLATLERDAPALRESGDLLALSVPLRVADPELNARVRRCCRTP